jgi:hypothetical protein
MHKNRRIPRTIKLARASMKTFGGFVKENVATRQNDLMRGFTKEKGESPLFGTKKFARGRKIVLTNIVALSTYFLANLQ